MFNLGQLSRLSTAARGLRLSPLDTARFLWSYYGSRFPGGASRSSSRVAVKVRSEKLPLTLALRVNGFDFDVLEEMFVDRVYEVAVSPVRRILDLGANVGISAAFFSALYPDAEIACVEPVADNLAVLRENVALNHLRATILPVAVGASEGHLDILLREDPRQNAPIGGQFRDVSAEKIVRVEMKPVERILSELGWETVDLVKIDIEGGEKSVLGSHREWLSRVRSIVGEGHLGYPYTVDDVLADLEPAGFNVKILRVFEGSFHFFAQR